MGMYVSVRGWLELDFAHRPNAERIIEADTDDLYSGGWAWPTKPFNWTLYLFYGGDIRESALQEIRAQVEQLAALSPVDEDDDRPRGVFMVTNEWGQARCWHIRDGAVLDVPVPGSAFATAPSTCKPAEAGPTPAEPRQSAP
ncbi:hypothetical protein [Nonomuraea sp. SBT364]|uniref:hypothetical protein n=1 Tax=Nonomuraea sp. SBT364 TaxID=1580530 RepID=UPI00066A58F3|nr:hypothetical protein [Nonomuraea sp. SBT364]